MCVLVFRLGTERWQMMVQVLQKIRGVSTTDKALQAELDDIQKAVTQTQSEQTSIFLGLASLTRRYPQILFASVIIPIAQQFTGMNAIMFVSAAAPIEPVALCASVLHSKLALILLQRTLSFACNHSLQNSSRMAERCEHRVWQLTG